MNYSWDTHAYQQGNRISPHSATDCARSVSVTIASTSDHGLTGTNRDRPGLRLTLAGCRAGDTLVVTKLDRLARSQPDARGILDDL